MKTTELIAAKVLTGFPVNNPSVATVEKRLARSVMSFASTQPEFDELYAGAVQEVFAIMHQSRPVS